MNSPVKILQISDCHLFADAAGKLLGLNTEYSLGLVLDLILENDSDADALFVTGDVSQDASLASYRRIKQLLANRLPVFGTQKPLFWLPGNHDHPDVMSQVFSASGMAPLRWDSQGWRIICLDSHQPNEVAGRLTEEQLAYLTASLFDSLESESLAFDHVLVFLHHHPVAINSDWLDRIGLQNTDALWRCVDACAQVRGLVWGHVHQAFEASRQGVRLFSTPSTCVQFKPKSRDFSIDERAPGYRWLTLFPDGCIESGVRRVTQIDFEVDYSVKGY